MVKHWLKLNLSTLVICLVLTAFSPINAVVWTISWIAILFISALVWLV